MYLSVGAFACVGKCRPFRAHIILSVCTQGFLSGFALIPPWAMRECRPVGAFLRIGRLRCCVVVLCLLNVFGFVNGLLRSFVFLYLFDCYCMRCGIGGIYGNWGIDWCGRAISPFRGDTPAKPRAQALG